MSRNQMKKWMFLLVAVAMVIFGVNGITSLATEQKVMAAGNVIASGSYGNVTWVIDGDGVLTVQGIGEFTDQTGADRAPWYEYAENIKSAVINLSGTKDLSWMFSGCSYLTEIDMTGLDTSSATDMSGMFSWCNQMESLNLSTFETSNVTDMTYMFEACQLLKSLDLSTFDTSNVTDMSGMFFDCWDLESLNISSFNTSNVTDMSLMFMMCVSLSELDLKNFNTSKVTDMTQMFSGPNLDGVSSNNSFITLNLESFDTSNVTSMDEMFFGCANLTSLNLKNFDTSSVTDMWGMFWDCEGLTELDLSSFDTSNVSYMGCMFYNCNSITCLDLSGFDLANVTWTINMFEGMTALSKIYTPVNLTVDMDLPATDEDNWHATDGTEYTALPLNLPYSIVLERGETEEQKVTVAGNVIASGSYGNVTWVIDGDGVLTVQGTGEFAEEMINSTQFDRAPWYDYALKINSAVISLSGIKDLSYMFSNCQNLTDIDFSALDTSSVTNMQGMFGNCKSLTSIDLTNFDTSNVINMKEMFSGCNGSVSLDLSGFDTSNVINMARMFQYSGMESLDLSGFDTSKVTDMSSMFESSSVLYLDLSSFDTSNVENMGGMFAYCVDLVEVNLSGFNTSKVTNMESMFFLCECLVELNLNSFDTSKVTDMIAMFSGCSRLSVLDVTSFDTANVTDMSGMFLECSNLTCLDLSSFDMKNVTVSDTYTIGWMTALNQIDTPINLTHDIKLPAEDGEAWYSEDGTEYTVLPQNLSYSIVLTKSEKKEENENGGSGYANIVSLSPESGATDVGYDASDVPQFSITFDRNILGMETDNKVTFANLNFDVGTMRIYRAADDELIYEVDYDSYVNNYYKYNGVNITGATSSDIQIVNGTTLQLDPFNAHTLFTSGTKYYITLDEGFIQFEDGTVNSAIEKGDWTFRTSGTGEFYFESSVEGVEKYTYYYNENWFFEEPGSSELNIELLSMSIRVSMAAYGVDDSQSTSEKANAANILKLMDVLGFDYDDGDYKSYFYPVPTYNSVGYAIGNKTIINDEGDTCTLIMVAIRSGGYADEWGGNFNVGNGEDGDYHYGFQIASDTVLKALETYINTHRNEFDDDIKIWISGYSRGAAVTNLTAAALDDGRIEGIALNNVYAFCFECPQNTTDSNVNNARYANIINIVNLVDLVPKVAPSDWGFTRYGKTYYLPTYGTVTNYVTLRNSMKENYISLLDYNRINYSDEDIIQYAWFSTAQEAIFDDILNKLSSVMVNRIIYASYYQNTISDLMATAMGGASPAFNSDDLLNLIEALNARVILEADYPQDIIFVSAGAVESLLSEAMKYLILDCKIEEAHYAELTMSWLDSLSGSYYVEEGSSSGSVLSTSAITRKCYLNCPVDVSVYNSAGVLVAQFIDDVAQEIEEGVPAYIDMDGQKVICLPTDDEYSMEITATDDGEFTYTVTEYDLGTSETVKIEGYQKLDISEGDVLTGHIDNLESTDNAQYSLALNGTELTADLIESEDISEFTVTVDASGNGSATGGGSYVSGEFAKVTATADTEAEFIGWYIGDELVSEDEEYRFLVINDTDLLALFSTDAAYVNEEDGSDFTISRIYLIAAGSAVLAVLVIIGGVVIVIKKRKRRNMVKMKRCNNCGSIINEEVKFCPNCGMTYFSSIDKNRAAKKHRKGN